MKNVIFLLAALFLMNSCLKENKDNDLTQDILFQMIVSGPWEVTVFSKDDIIKTSDFSDYTFNFLATNDIRASFDTNLHFGDWYVFKDPDNKNAGTGFTFHISFSEPVNFAELTGDWNVLEATASLVRLELVNEGGINDYLTFMHK